MFGKAIQKKAKKINYRSAMINLYWPVYKNIEKEVLELSNQIHFDDSQLSIYSIKISELLIRCSVEIEAISKDLFISQGGTIPTDGNFYFDTDCLNTLENNWLLSKKKLTVSAPNFYFENEENRILTPLNKANKRGSSSCEWKKAYQAVKHDRTANLKKGNIKNLLKALGALFILNVYYKNEIFELKGDSHATGFSTNLGSGIFAIKLHQWLSYDVNFNYGKKDDFSECIYWTRYTEDSLEKNRKATAEMIKEQQRLFLQHPKFSKYLEKNTLQGYQGRNLMWDVLGKDDYWKIIEIAGRTQLEVSNKSQFEAILNKSIVEN
jgi:hypothetical protein